MKNDYEKKGGIQQVGQSLIEQVATYCRFNVFIHLNALVSGIQGFLGSWVPSDMQDEMEALQ